MQNKTKLIRSKSKPKEKILLRKQHDTDTFCVSCLHLVPHTVTAENARLCVREKGVFKKRLAPHKLRGKL